MLELNRKKNDRLKMKTIKKYIQLFGEGLADAVEHTAEEDNNLLGSFENSDAVD